MRFRSFLALICCATGVTAGGAQTTLIAPQAQLLSVLPLSQGGGFSGIELSEDGQAFFLVSDGGYLMSGSVNRAGDTLESVSVTAVSPLKNGFGEPYKPPHANAEGIARDGRGRLNIAFEKVHRIMRYDVPGGRGVWPGYLPFWRSLPDNEGMEAIAVDAAGTLYAFTENGPDAQSLVFRRAPGEEWEHPFTLPLSDGYLVTGADVGPDGFLYVLERFSLPPLFASRVRRMRITPGGLTGSVTVLQTFPGQHGNLEGLAVWQDSAGVIKLTMVSDNNFLALLRSELVEYILKE